MKLDKYLKEGPVGWTDVDDIREDIKEEIIIAGNDIQSLVQKRMDRMIHVLESKLSKYSKEDIGQAVDSIGNKYIDDHMSYVSPYECMEYLKELK